MGERDAILKDKRFWLHLEFAASGWLATSDAKELRNFWVDGFDPLSFRNTRRGMEIEGIAWVMGGQLAHRKVPFCVAVPQKLLHRPVRDFEIESFELEEAGKSLTIVLSAARNGPASLP